MDPDEDGTPVLEVVEMVEFGDGNNSKRGLREVAEPSLAYSPPHVEPSLENAYSPPHVEDEVDHLHDHSYNDEGNRYKEAIRAKKKLQTSILKPIKLEIPDEVDSYTVQTSQSSPKSPQSLPGHESFAGNESLAGDESLAWDDERDTHETSEICESSEPQMSIEHEGNKDLASDLNRCDKGSNVTKVKTIKIAGRLSTGKIVTQKVAPSEKLKVRPVTCIKVVRRLSTGKHESENVTKSNEASDLSSVKSKVMPVKTVKIIGRLSTGNDDIPSVPKNTGKSKGKRGRPKKVKSSATTTEAHTESPKAVVSVSRRNKRHSKKPDRLFDSMTSFDIKTEPEDDFTSYADDISDIDDENTKSRSNSKNKCCFCKKLLVRTKQPKPVSVSTLTSSQKMIKQVFGTKSKARGDCCYQCARVFKQHIIINQEPSSDSEHSTEEMVVIDKCCYCDHKFDRNTHGALQSNLISEAKFQRKYEQIIGPKKHNHLQACNQCREIVNLHTRKETKGRASTLRIKGGCLYRTGSRAEGVECTKCRVAPPTAEDWDKDEYTHCAVCQTRFPKVNVHPIFKLKRKRASLIGNESAMTAAFGAHKRPHDYICQECAEKLKAKVKERVKEQKEKHNNKGKFQGLSSVPPGTAPTGETEWFEYLCDRIRRSKYDVACSLLLKRCEASRREMIACVMKLVEKELKQLPVIPDVIAEMCKQVVLFLDKIEDEFSVQMPTSRQLIKMLVPSKGVTVQVDTPAMDNSASQPPTDATPSPQKPPQRPKRKCTTPTSQRGSASKRVKLDTEGNIVQNEGVGNSLNDTTLLQDPVSSDGFVVTPIVKNRKKSPKSPSKKTKKGNAKSSFVTDTPGTSIIYETETQSATDRIAQYIDRTEQEQYLEGQAERAENEHQRIQYYHQVEEANQGIVAVGSDGQPLPCVVRYTDRNHIQLGSNVYNAERGGYNYGDNVYSTGNTIYNSGSTIYNAGNVYNSENVSIQQAIPLPQAPPHVPLDIFNRHAPT